MILGLFFCLQPVAVDGDTLKCANLPRPGLVRLAAIDAPEMPGNCRRNRRCAPGDPHVARTVLRYLIAGEVVVGRQVDARPDRAGFQQADPHGRPVARLTIVQVTGTVLDLSDELLRQSLVVPWP